MSGLLEELQALEARLLALGPECPQACAEGLLALEFREFGSSGRMLSRSDVLREIVNAPGRLFVMSDVQLNVLSEDAALLTYAVVVDGRASIRSSLWVRRENLWQMLFHQGTISRT